MAPAGLAGTGSHHFHVDDLFVPEDRTLVPLRDTPCFEAAIARVPPPALLALSVASVAIGIGQGALEDILALAPEKTPLLAETTLARNTRFQFQIANGDATLRAARSLLRESAEEAWAAAAAAEPLTLRTRARIRAAAVWAVEHAADVATTAQRAAGASSVPFSTPLARRLRDMNVLTQHFLVSSDTLTTAGAALAGEDIKAQVF